jgi:hypothetical protein
MARFAQMVVEKSRVMMRGCMGQTFNEIDTCSLMSI